MLKATRVAGQLNDAFFRNRHFNIEMKARIYKTIQPILTYAAEMRLETSKTRQNLETTKIKTVRRIARKPYAIEIEANTSEEPVKWTLSTNGFWKAKNSRTII